MAHQRLSASSARLAVIDAMRSGRTTVTAISVALGVSDNAVRLHLAALERDGLVGRLGTLHSGRAGQPAVHYELTADGERSLSRAYAPALTALAAALGDRLQPRILRSVFADAGQRLVDPGRAASGTFAQRAESCAALITSLGGKATVEVGRGEAIIVGQGCPLAAAVRAEPGMCTLIEAMLARHAGLKARQQCEHGDHPHCRFAINA